MVHPHPSNKEAKLPTAKVKKKIHRRKLQPPDDRSGPDVQRLKPQLSHPSQRRPQRADVRPGPDDRPHSPASG